MSEPGAATGSGVAAPRTPRVWCDRRVTTPRRAARGAVLLPLALAGVLVTSACTGSGDDPAASASTTAATAATTPAEGATSASTEPSTPSGPPASTAPVVGESTLPAAGLGQAVDFGDGLSATVESVEDVQLTAEGPGEVAGPGVAVRVSLRNGTTARVDLGGVLVSTTYADGAPGDPSTSAPSDVPTGVLEPGGSAEGTWVFSRPSGSQGSVEVSVGSISSSSVVVVRS